MPRDDRGLGARGVIACRADVCVLDFDFVVQVLHGNAAAGIVKSHPETKI